MTRSTTLSRRSALGLFAAGLASVALPKRGFAQINTLNLFGPPAGPSITLAHAVATDRFEGIAQSATFTAWRNPDELRAGLTSGLTIADIEAWPDILQAVTEEDIIAAAKRVCDRRKAVTGFVRTETEEVTQ